MQDENMNGAQGYHIIDENDLNNDDDEDLEELDDDERKSRHEEMLKGLKEKLKEYIMQWLQKHNFELTQ